MARVRRRATAVVRMENFILVIVFLEVEVWECERRPLMIVIGCLDVIKALGVFSAQGVVDGEVGCSIRECQP